MREINKIIAGLKNTQRLLRDLLADADEKQLKDRRMEGKWCAHEHAVHFMKVEALMIERLRRFMTEKRPVFAAYVPGVTTPPDELLKLDLKESLKKFARDRRTFIGMLKQFSPKDLRKEGEHARFKKWSPYIMAHHLLMHDGVHMYRLEELLLFKEIAKR